VSRPAALRLQHQCHDQRQGTSHDQDDAERVVGHEWQIDIERKEKDRANHDQDNAYSDTHLFLLLFELLTQIEARSLVVLPRQPIN
jgi:hypothetical protein